MQTLRYSQLISASRKTVWRLMLDPAGYREWTAAFCDGSRFEGSWDKGAKIRFLGSDGGGMTSEIAEHRPAEFVSIRHLGFIQGGVDDVDGAAMTSWPPAYENYIFTDAEGGTRVDVSVDILDEYVAMMEESYPKALKLLKTLCERAPR